MMLPGRAPLILRRTFNGARPRMRRSLLTASYVEGPSEPPLSFDTIPEHLQTHILPRYASRPALICTSERPRPHGGPISHNLGIKTHLSWDYEEFDRHVLALAKGLLRMGVEKGSRVGVVMGNCSAYCLLQIATARIGAILVPLNPAYKIHELIAALNFVSVSHLFIVPQFRSSAYLSILTEAAPSLASAEPNSISDAVLPHLRSLVVFDNSNGSGQFPSQMAKVRSAIDFKDVFVWENGGVEEGRVKDLLPTLKPDDIINLHFTSGTTGAPKAVALTQTNLLNNGRFIGHTMRLTPEDKICCPPPLFHCFGLVLGNLTVWTHGSSIVYPSETYDAKAAVDALVSERATGLHGVPTHFIGVLEEVKKRGELKLPNLRTGLVGGSPIPIELMRQLIDRLNLRELQAAYGMTETSPVAFQIKPDDEMFRRVETVGTVHPHVKAKIVDSQNKVVPIGVPGEVVIGGYLLQKGYWENPEQTALAMQRHEDDPTMLWMHTGDQGVMDEHGYLRSRSSYIYPSFKALKERTVSGRIKDVIIRGGENLFPVAIENVVTQHPSVQDAAAIAVPDATFGEVVGLVIVRDKNTTKVTRTEIRDWVHQGINPQNKPVFVWFVGEDGIEDEMPLTASGKVQKNILRERASRWSKLGVGKVQ